MPQNTERGHRNSGGGSIHSLELDSARMESHKAMIIRTEHRRGAPLSGRTLSEVGGWGWRMRKKAHAGKRGQEAPREVCPPSLASQPAGPSHTYPRTTGRGPLTRWCTFGPMEPPFPERHGQGVHGFSLLLKMGENAIEGCLPEGHSPFSPSPGGRETPDPSMPQPFTYPGPPLP